MRYTREAALLEHYNSNAHYYSPIDSTVGVNLLLEKFNLSIEDELTVLDVGCGDGRLARNWPKASVVGVDISPVRIDIAKKKSKGEYHCKDIYDFLESELRRFDLGVAVEILEHLEMPMLVIDLMLDRCDRVIGTLPVNMPYIAHLDVYPTIDSVYEKLAPDNVIEDGEHFYCEWTGV